jgi:serine/arginine repetitive matrix protein 1
MTKVNLDTIKPWINGKVTEHLNFEDDVVIEFVYNQLEERVKILLIRSLYY